jgi:hypothetical protein
MVGAMIVFNYIGGALIAFIFFYAYSDGSWSAVLRWTIFYLVVIVNPIRLARRTSRQMSALGHPLPDQVRKSAYNPVWVGLMALIAALALVQGAGER